MECLCSILNLREAIIPRALLERTQLIHAPLFPGSHEMDSAMPPHFNESAMTLPRAIENRDMPLKPHIDLLYDFRRVASGRYSHTEVQIQAVQQQVHLEKRIKLERYTSPE